MKTRKTGVFSGVFRVFRVFRRSIHEYPEYSNRAFWSIQRSIQEGPSLGLKADSRWQPWNWQARTLKLRSCRLTLRLSASNPPLRRIGSRKSTVICNSGLAQGGGDDHLSGDGVPSARARHGNSFNSVSLVQVVETPVSTAAGCASMSTAASPGSKYNV